LAELVEGHGVHVAATKSNFSDIAQQAVQSVLESGGSAMARNDGGFDGDLMVI
jgi:hypothetical protein